MLADALARFLLADDAAAAIRAELALYAGEPAVFTTEIPEDAALPAISIIEVGGPRWGMRDTKGAVAHADVQLIGDKDANATDLGELADALRTLLHRCDLDPYVEGADAIWCFADPPKDTQAGLGFPGCTISVQALLLAAGGWRFLLNPAGLNVFNPSGKRILVPEAA